MCEIASIQLLAIMRGCIIAASHMCKHTVKPFWSRSSNYEYIIITTIRSYTGKYHEFSCCLYCYECAVRVTMPTATNEWYFIQLLWWLLMILSYEVSISLHVEMQCAWPVLPDKDSHMTCRTDMGFGNEICHFCMYLYRNAL